MGMELAKGWKINKNNKVPLLCTFKNFERMQVSLFLAALEISSIIQYANQIMIAHHEMVI
jgi:hypothetical protein